MLHDAWMAAFKISGTDIALDTTSVVEAAPARGNLNDNLKNCITATGQLRIIIST